MDAPSIGMIPSGYKDGKLYSVYPLEGLGEELVTNGTFDTDSNWTKGTGWSISGGKASRTAQASSSVLTADNTTLTVGKTYKCVMTISDYSSGSARFETGSTGFTLYSENGTFVEYIVATGTTFSVKGNSDFTGSIDNVSVKEDTSADLDFVRGSLATRVNAQGLVEDVNIISEELVQNGNFDEIGSEEVSNGDFSQEGSELVVNGGFDTDSDWILGTGWSISGGTVNQDGSNGILRQNNVVSLNTKVKVTFDLSNYGGSGILQIKTAPNTYAVALTGDGSYTVFTDGTNSVNGDLQIITASGFTGSIDNVSVVEVGQDWIFPDGWEIGDNKASFDFNIAGASNLRQNDVLTVGKIYKLTFDTLDSNEGNLGYYFGGNATFINNIEANTTYTVYGEAVGTYLSLRGSSNFIGSVTNISVKEVGQNWTFGTGWSMGDGKAVFDGFSNVSLQQDGIVANNKKYRLTYTILDYVQGGLKWRFGLDTNLTPVRNANGTYVEEIISTGSDFRAITDGATELSIDNVSVKEITDATDLPRLNYDDITWQDALSDELVTNGTFDTDSDWNKDSNWTISGGKATSDGSDGYMSSVSNVFTSGVTYRVEITVSNMTTGRVSFPYDGAGQTYVASNGVHSQTYVADDNNKCWIRANNGFDGSVDNVSVKEITGQEVASSGCPSLLLEPQSTNLITHSEDFSDSSWLDANINVLSNQIVSPEGIINADLIESADSSSCYVSASYLSLTIGNTYTFSCFAKKGNNRWIRMGHVSSSSTGCWFDLENGVVGTANSESATIKDYGNGWYRLTNTFVAISSGGSSVAFIAPSEADNSTNAGAIGQTNYIWGAQLEELPYASSYIPTNGSVQTRLKDQASRSGLQDHINSTEGVLYAEIAALADDGTSRRISLSNGTSSNRILLYFNPSNKIQALNVTGGSVQGNMTHTLDITQFNKIAFKYKENDFALWVNGVEVNTDTSGLTYSTGTLDRLGFDNAIGIENLYGKVKDLRVYTTALSDEDLQYLTS